MGSILGLYWDNGKEDANYSNILGLYWDNGKEDANYCSILGLYWDNGKEIETTVVHWVYIGLILG